MTALLATMAWASITSGVVLIAFVAVRRSCWPVQLPAGGISDAPGPEPVALAYANSVEQRYVVDEPANPLVDYPVRDTRTGDVVSEHFELSRARNRAAELNAAASLQSRVTRSCVCLYRGHCPDVQLMAVWRWSRRSGELVAYDRRHPEWSPAWTRDVAERAWGAR